MKLHLNITGKLTFILVMFGAALLGSLGALAYINGRAGLQQAATSELITRAIEKQAAVDNWIAVARSVIATQAESPVVAEQAAALLAAEPGSPESSSAHDRLVREFQPHVDLNAEFTELFFIEAETGQVLVSTDPDEEGKFKENQTYFINGRNEPNVSEMYYSVALGRPAMTAAAPVISVDGRLLGVLAGRLDLDDFNTLINRRSGLRQTDDAYVVNAIGLLVTQPRFLPDPAIMQVKLETESIQRCLEGNSGVISAVDYRGVPALISYRWLPSEKMCLIVKIDQAEAFASSLSFGRTLAWASGLALVLGAALAIVLARKFTRPILALQTGAARIGGGEMDFRLPETSSDEVGQLAREFNHMAEALQQRAAALSESEKNYRYLVENTMVGVYKTNLAGEILYVNEALAHMMGFDSAEEMRLGGVVARYKHPETRQRLLETLRQAGRAESFEAEVLTQQGQTKTILLSATLERDTLSGMVIDITERKRAEETLRAKHELFQKTFDISPVATLLGKLPERTIIDINPAFEKLFGYIRAEIIGRPIKEFDLWADPSERQRNTEILLKSGKIHNMEFVFKTKSGETGHGIFYSEIIEQVEDKYILTKVMDITERKRAEEERRRNAERATALAEISQSLAEVTNDPQASLNLIARRVTELIGDATLIRLVSLDGLHLDPVAVYHPDPETTVQMRELYASVRQSVNEGFAPRIFQTGQALLIPSITKEQMRASIEPRLWPMLELHSVHSVIIAPLHSQGRIIGLLSVMRTQPDKPYIEEDRDFLQDLADRAALALTNSSLLSDLQTYTAKLEQSNRDLQEFAYVASHDLQEPLRKVQSFSDRLATKKYEDALDETGRDYLKRMHTASQRMQILINDLLGFSRVSTLAQPFTKVDLKALAQEVLSDLENQIERTKGRVEIGDLPMIEADPTQMRQLLQNLIGNALKFRHEERAPLIKVSARIERDACHLSVEDNGIGFDPQYLDRIFKPFQRLHNREEYEGSGMGLAICRRIVERHGGSITATSTLGKGTTFLVTLPIHPSKGDK